MRMSQRMALVILPNSLAEAWGDLCIRASKMRSVTSKARKSRVRAAGALPPMAPPMAKAKRPLTGLGLGS